MFAQKLLALFGVFIALIGVGLAAPEGAARLIDGQDVDTLSQFPHHVYIIPHGSSHRCGGTILNERWVVTSASCVKNCVRLDLNFGKKSLNNTRADFFSVSVNSEHVFLYPTDYDDIALIKIPLRLEFSKTIAPVTISKLSTRSLDHRFSVMPGFNEILDVRTTTAVWTPAPTPASTPAPIALPTPRIPSVGSTTLPPTTTTRSTTTRATTKTTMKTTPSSTSTTTIVWTPSLAPTTTTQSTTKTTTSSTTTTLTTAQPSTTLGSTTSPERAFPAEGNLGQYARNFEVEHNEHYEDGEHHDHRHHHAPDPEVDNLKYGMFEIVDHHVCKRALGEGRFDEYTQLCVKGWGSNPNAPCCSDFGSGLIVGWPAQSELVGIFSMFSPSCTSKDPSIFTYVAKYMPWIESMIRG